MLGLEYISTPVLVGMIGIVSVAIIAEIIILFSDKRKTKHQTTD